jgi:hypothetical protein
MPDQPSPRRRFQFSLRTLMIVVTLSAAQCAFVAWVVRDRQRLIRERDDALRAAEEKRAERAAVAANRDLDVQIDDVTGKLNAATDRWISGQRRIRSGNRLSADERARIQRDLLVYMREADSYRSQLSLLMEKKKKLEVRNQVAVRGSQGVL